MDLIRIISENRVKIAIMIVLLILLFISTILINLIIGVFINDHLIRLKLQRIVFLYSILNTLLLGLMGYLLLHYIIIKPINQLTLKTENIKEVDQIPFIFEMTKTSSEIGRLSHSLLKLIRKMEEDRKQLQRSYEELKKAQSDLIRSEKLASIGRLSSGVAHEIGNPLGIVLGYMELLKRPDISPEERGDYLKRSCKELERIKGIIEQLLDYARYRDSKDLSTISVHEILKDTVEILRPQKGMKEIKIKWSLNAQYDMVMGSRERMRQLFLNILLNALDALNEKKEKTEKEIEIITNNKDINGRNMLITEIKDNGAGIKPYNLPHVFEPFFTTKEPGKGTGLGLSVCRTIVEAMGGEIVVKSTPEKGTSINIILPINTA